MNVKKIAFLTVLVIGCYFVSGCSVGKNNSRILKSGYEMDLNDITVVPISTQAQTNATDKKLDKLADLLFASIQENRKFFSGKTTAKTTQNNNGVKKVPEGSYSRKESSFSEKINITKEQVFIPNWQKRIQANEARSIQNKKSISELSLMTLLNRYGKDKTIALRYSFLIGAVEPSKTFKDDSLILKSLEKQGCVKVSRIESYSDDSGDSEKNKKIAKKRLEVGYDILVGRCIPIAGLTKATFPSVNFHGSKKDNRCIVVYVEILKDFNFEKLKAQKVVRGKETINKK